MPDPENPHDPKAVGAEQRASSTPVVSAREENAVRTSLGQYPGAERDTQAQVATIAAARKSNAIRRSLGQYQGVKNDVQTLKDRVAAAVVLPQPTKKQ